jgi:hypothetical protein
MLAKLWQARPFEPLGRAFSRTVDARVYALLRIGFALLLLVRQSDVLARWVPLDHHGWVHGLDFSWSVAREPHLVSPLVPGLALGPTACTVLVYVRTALACGLLVGLRSRWCAAGLAFVSYWLMFSDRFQYLHHLHLLFLSIAWLSLAPLDARLSAEAWLRGLPTVARAPAWPLLLLRALVMSIYLAAGLAKLSRGWLSGETLRVLEVLGTLRGPAWQPLRDAVGYSAIAWAVALGELALPLLLAHGVTRRAAVYCGWALHVGVSASMNVSTFGAEMAWLLIAFLPSTDRSPA